MQDDAAYTSDSADGILFLWPLRVLYIGRMREPARLAHATAAFMVGLDSPLILEQESGAQPICSHSLLLPPGVPVHVQSNHSLYAVFYLDALQQDYHALLQQMECVQGQINYRIQQEDRVREELLALQSFGCSARQAHGRVQSLLFSARQPDAETPAVDARVIRAVELIKATAGTNYSLEQLANELNISVPRLVQLFRRDVGVPVRRFRQWHRLHRAVFHIATGAPSYTDAAIAAGFSDLAHFSNTFRNMLGLSPSFLFSDSAGIQVRIDEDLITQGFTRNLPNLSSSAIPALC